MTIPKIIGFLSLPVYVTAISILAYLQFPTIFESIELLLILNTVFIGLIPIAIAYLAARVYLISGTVSFMLMGCGMLTFGLSSILAAALISLPDGPNILVTIHNSGVLVGSICQAIGGLLFISSGTSWTLRSKGNWPIISVYAGVVVLILLFSVATALGYLPRFFIQGTGPTLLRQLVLISAMNLYVVSSALFVIHYKKMRSDFLYWYTLSLAMISIGLLGIVLQTSVGCPIGWLGRSAQYIGGFFGLIAILKAASSANSQKMSIEESIAFLFWDVESSYKNLVEMANDGIITFEQTGRIIAWNPAAERMFDRSKTEIIGSSFFDLLIPDKYSDNLQTQIESLRKSSSQVTTTKATEIEVRRKDGSIFPVELSLSLRKTPIGWLCMGIVRDVSERKRAEEALWRLASIVESSDDAIIGKTLDGSITSWNKGAESLYGYRSDEVIGQPVSILLPPELCDDFWDILTRINRGEIVSHFETKRRRKDGGIIEVSLTISPIKNPAGQIIGASSTARDITERNLLEKERQKVFVELQKALSEVKKLSGFLPICSSCKKIRDDKGYWSEVERYIGEHSEAQFSHSICPDCMRKLYPEYADEVLRDLEKKEKK